MVTRRIVWLLAPLGLMTLLLVAGPLLRSAQAVDMKGAWDDLEQLKRSMKPKKTNEDLVQYLDAVFNAFKDETGGPPKPADDASDDAKRDYERELAKWQKDREKFREEAEKLILKISVLVKVQRGTNTNIRDEVNIKAAQILGEMAPLLDERGRHNLSGHIMRLIDRKLTKVKTYELNADHLDAMFAALGKLNDMDSIAWILKNHVHANYVQEMYLVAADKALVLFKNVPGRVRHAVCDEFVRVYASVESQAEQSSNDKNVLAKKRFWDDIKTYAIPVVQYYAQQPKNDQGAVLKSMGEFQKFMRDHRNLRRPPWVDPKPVK